jgi:reactive intermediate/imine deaminase
MAKTTITTDRAPAAIGTYSQAVKSNSTVYISGQIPLDPETMALADESFAGQCEQVFENLKAIVEAAGGSLQDVLKLTVYLVDLRNFAQVNEIMARYFVEPYPARVAVGIAALPKEAQVEIDAIMEVSET